MLLSDRFLKRIIELKSPVVVGLDPVLRRIPEVFKEGRPDSAEGASDALLSFNRAVIDAVCPYVPAVKPQLAFYEMYGSAGMAAYEQTVVYAKTKGLFVIADGKKNDIGNTASAYADAYLGEAPMISGATAKNPGSVDFLTVSPYLGDEGLSPFIEVAAAYDKGLFILVKTSNEGSGVIQDAVTSGGGVTVSEYLARLIAAHSKKGCGEYGYSSIGAVVGATYPKAAAALRGLMPSSIILVPGYGAQGAGIDDIRPCFDARGSGALVNSSRAILCAYRSEKYKGMKYYEAARKAAMDMAEDLRRI